MHRSIQKSIPRSTPRIYYLQKNFFFFKRPLKFLPAFKKFPNRNQDVYQPLNNE